MKRRSWVAVLGLLLAACAPAAAPASAPPATAPQLTEVSAGQSPPPAAEATRPPVRDDFVATDPATVELAAGRPQLVEFFAFY